MSQPYDRYPNEGAAGTPPAAAAPSDVRTSHVLWLVFAGVWAVLTLLAFLSLDQLVASVAAQSPPQPELDAEQFEALLSGTFITIFVMLLVVAGLVVLFAMKMRAGRNWARIVLTVIGGFGVLFALLNLVGAGVAGAGWFGLLVNLVQLVGIGAAIFLMYRPAANAYFH